MSFNQRLVLLRPSDVRWVRDVSFGYGFLVGIALGIGLVWALWRVSTVAS